MPVCVMVRVLAGVKELGRAAALAQRTGRGPPSSLGEEEGERRSRGAWVGGSTGSGLGPYTEGPQLVYW